jgi:hypothetical protein
MLSTTSTNIMRCCGMRMRSSVGVIGVMNGVSFRVLPSLSLSLPAVWRINNGVNGTNGMRWQSNQSSSPTVGARVDNAIDEAKKKMSDIHHKAADKAHHVYYITYHISHVHVTCYMMLLCI